MSSATAEIQLPVDFEEQYVNGVSPHWVRLLKLLEMNVRHERCSGADFIRAKLSGWPEER